MQASTTQYYMLDGQRIALRQNNTLSFLLSDHLGSTSLTLNSSGTETGELRYSQWGGTRYSSGATPTDRRFTGQVLDDSTLITNAPSIHDLAGYSVQFGGQVAIGPRLTAEVVIFRSGETIYYGFYIEPGVGIAPPFGLPIHGTFEYAEFFIGPIPTVDED